MLAVAQVEFGDYRGERQVVEHQAHALPGECSLDLSGGECRDHGGQAGRSGIDRRLLARAEGGRRGRCGGGRTAGEFDLHLAFGDEDVDHVGGATHIEGGANRAYGHGAADLDDKRTLRIFRDGEVGFAPDQPDPSLAGSEGGFEGAALIGLHHRSVVQRHALRGGNHPQRHRSGQRRGGGRRQHEKAHGEGCGGREGSTPEPESPPGGAGRRGQEIGVGLVAVRRAPLAQQVERAPGAFQLRECAAMAGILPQPLQNCVLFRGTEAPIAAGQPLSGGLFDWSGGILRRTWSGHWGIQGRP